MTYRELKTTLENLKDEQLDQTVQCISETGTVRIDKPWILEEDHINPSGEGIEPISTYKNDPDFDLDSESISFEKDTVLLLVDEDQPKRK